MYHVVLFEIRSDLIEADRERLQRTVEDTLQSIPAVKRWAIGRRTELGLSYEPLMQPGYGHVAVIEFGDRARLRDYLEHPLHAELAALFWSCSERTLVFDYEIIARSPAASPGES
jgi:hypothetical protein